ncbi:TetR/AcrR family transcriptional regulator [Nocardioides rotundus]|uniref:TetR/AcrR family transcriptional regulator n=1 Tax=Nocardioides rotundus TaxID=1774216 RepID=UPI001CBD0FA0|nr:TetR/AcrR family transcriptional regulator [Nocardioides rotundus]UAL28525.1 TetR/AcrR family transcriptional regulator [Nocardioides rotundus]
MSDIAIRPAERLLDAADTLFVQQGIRAVGIDAVLRSAGVARASLYQTYGSKDGLVAAYLRRCDERDRAAYEAARADVGDPAEEILLVFDLAAANAPRHNFRGCLYLNVATEFPDHEHPVYAVIEAHRAWLASVWRSALERVGVSDPEGTLAELTVIYDGGLAGSKVARSTGPIESARKLARRCLRD